MGEGGLSEIQEILLMDKKNVIKDASYLENVLQPFWILSSTNMRQR